MRIKLTIFVTLTVASAHASTIISDLNVGPPASSHFLNVVGGSYTGAIGQKNLVSADFSLAIGESNTVVPDDNENGSLAVGKLNYIQAFDAICGGYGNQVFRGYSITAGQENVNTENNSLVIGQFNITSYNFHPNGMVLGSYNAPIAKPAHLVIGNGYLNTPRKNSFIVYADGDIVITKPQGDISMGIYE